MGAGCCKMLYTIARREAIRFMTCFLYRKKVNLEIPSFSMFSCLKAVNAKVGIPVETNKALCSKCLDDGMW